MLTPPQECLNYIENLPTSSPDKYKIIQMISHGGYGVINKAIKRNHEDSGFFALKTNRHKGFEGRITDIDYNEVRSLQTLQNEKNVVKLIELLKDTKEFTLVLEFCKTDLAKILDKNFRLPLCDIKNILQQFFTGLKAIHRRNIMHRDLKPENILLAMDGTVKITDFGNSSELGSMLPYCTDVCTIWYKCPELLFGYEKYDEKVDLWAAGCLAAEFWMHKQALFQGTEDSSQMEKISKLCGFCNESIWPEAKEFPYYKKFHSAYGKYIENNLQKYLEGKIQHVGATAFLCRLLKLNAKERMTADGALNDVFFGSAPEASKDLSSLLKHLDAIGF